MPNLNNTWRKLEARLSMVELDAKYSDLKPLLEALDAYVKTGDLDRYQAALDAATPEQLERLDAYEQELIQLQKEAFF